MTVVHILYLNLELVNTNLVLYEIQWAVYDRKYNIGGKYMILVRKIR